MISPPPSVDAAVLGIGDMAIVTAVVGVHVTVWVPSAPVPERAEVDVASLRASDSVEDFAPEELGSNVARIVQVPATATVPPAAHVPPVTANCDGSVPPMLIPPALIVTADPVRLV